MNRHLFAVESVTYARKGRDLLLQAGIRASVERIPRPEKGIGCSYGIGAYGDAEQLTSMLRSGGIKVLYVVSGGAGHGLPR